MWMSGRAFESSVKGSRKTASRQCDAMRMSSLQQSPSTRMGSKVRTDTVENRACWFLLDQDLLTLARRPAKRRSCYFHIRKLDTQQLHVVRFAYHHSGQAFLKQVVNCVKAYWSTGQTQRGVHSSFQHGYHASVFPCWWETMTAEGHVKRFLSTSNP
jgi:hypothetical protein